MLKILHLIIYIIIIGLVCFVLGRLIPEHIFIEEWLIFKCFKFEKDGEIYKKLNIDDWQKEVPDMSKISKGLMQRKEIKSKPDIETTILMIRETCIAELIHYILIILGIGIFFIIPFPFNLIVYLIYVILGNLTFIVIQRYNRPRLTKLLAKLRKDVRKTNRLLILSSNNGGGHNSVANAIKEEYEAHGYGVVIKDGMSFVSKIKSNFEAAIHNFMYKHAPGIYSALWDFVEHNQKIFFSKYSKTRISLKLASKELARFINDGGYSTVICCHVFAGIMLSDTVKKFKLDIKTGIVETDYMNTPGCEYVDLDYHFISVKDYVPQLIALGIPFDKIVVSGIPVKKVVKNSFDKNVARNKLGLDVNKNQVLLMFGAEGNGPIKSILRNINNKLQNNAFVTVICGKNEKLFNSLSKKYATNNKIRVVGYSNEVAAYMDACDIIVSKSGGISLTESAIKHLGIVIFKTIGGCEKHNKDFFVRRGAAVSPLLPTSVAKSINGLLNDEKLLHFISENANSFAKENSTTIIFDKLENTTNNSKGVWKDTIKSLKGINSYADFFKMMEKYKNNIAGEENEEKRTYQEYLELSRYALGNFEKYNFKKNERVGLLLENSLDWPVVFWSLLASGAIPVLLNPNENIRTIQTILSEAKANNYVSNKELNGLDKKFINVKDILVKDQIGHETWSDYVAICTSGTTGKSRIFLYDAKTIAKQIISFNDAYIKNDDIPFNEDEKTKLLAFLPFNHVFGFSVVYLLYSCTGKTIVYLPNKAISTILDTCKKHQVTNLYCVPMFFNNLASAIENKVGDVKKLNEFEKKEIKNQLLGNQIRTLIVGGGHTPKKTLETINYLGYPLYNGFGMSECGVIAVETSKDIEQRIKGSIGFPFSITEYKCNSDNELLIRGDSLYTAIIVDGKIVKRNKNIWFHTGDIVDIKEDGLYIQGRNKDVVINANGENVYPDEIEDFFSKLSNVNRKCVLGIKDGEYEQLSLVVENNDQLDENTLINEVRDINNHLFINQRVINLYLSLKTLPISSTLKVIRKALKQEIENGTWPVKILKKLDVSLADEEIKKLPAYQKIVNEIKMIVQNIINDKNVEINENDNLMTKYNIDSLNLIDIIVEIEEKYDIKINNERMQSINSIADFAFLVYHELEIK